MLDGDPIDVTECPENRFQASRRLRMSLAHFMAYETIVSDYRYHPNTPIFALHLLIVDNAVYADL